jgi:hypothetical protein
MIEKLKLGKKPDLIGPVHPGKLLIREEIYDNQWAGPGHVRRLSTPTVKARSSVERKGSDRRVKPLSPILTAGDRDHEIQSSETRNKNEDPVGHHPPKNLNLKWDSR